MQQELESAIESSQRIKFHSCANIPRIRGVNTSKEKEIAEKPWRYMTEIQRIHLGSQTTVHRDSVVTVLSHYSRAQERSSSAKLNFRLSVAGDVPQLTIRFSLSPLLNQRRAARYTFLTLKTHMLSFCFVLLAWLDPRGYLGEEYLCVPRRRTLFLATPPSKRLKVKEKVSTRYLTHEQRSDTMRESTKGCQPHFWNLYSWNVDSWIFVVRAPNVGLLWNRPAQDAIPCRFCLI
jgi:hypothetical protein